MILVLGRASNTSARPQLFQPKNCKILQNSKMCMIMFLKVPSESLGPGATFFVLKPVFHGVSLKSYWQNKKNV